ncbi:MAG: D-glycero-alpha-D-manno-heptose-1,7-bisphosphate 7-phosphatase [Holophagaceae bacterium]|jgi:D-glycero-D-manno-heptose 1,7-bisphosphate phosphatase
MVDLDVNPQNIAFFLDRDGTVNKDVGYLHKVEHFELLPGSAAAIKMLNDRKYRVILVTNQSGIGIGLYSFDDLHAVNHEMSRQLALHGAHIDAIYASPFHPDGTGQFKHPDHPDRKPNPGMLLRAIHDWDINPTLSWMIGDRSVDVQAGRRAGTHTCQVRSGIGGTTMDPDAELVANDLYEAVGLILGTSSVASI